MARRASVGLHPATRTASQDYVAADDDKVTDFLDAVRELTAVGDPAAFPTVALASIDGLVPRRRLDL
jgi:hypothetical protein